MSESQRAQHTQYTIKQASKLYGISIDTLRYYEEIGLVIPERNPSNGYRTYRAPDFNKLNVITSLLDMGFSLTQIKSYLNECSLTNALELIEIEIDGLNRQIDELSKKRKKAESCLLGLAKHIHEAPFEEIKIREYDDRPYLTIAPTPSDPDEIPLLIAKKAHETGLRIDAFHNTPCFMLETSSVNDMGEFSSKNILMYSSMPTFETSTHFPKGRYLSITFSGGAQKTPQIYKRLCEHMNEDGLEPIGSPIEFWHVCESISSDPSEYIQTLEQMVAPTY